MGRKDLDHVVYRLIATPQSMSSQFSSLHGYRLDTIFPKLIRLTRFSGGNQLIYNQFIDHLKENKNIHFPSYSSFLLNTDLDKCISWLDEIKNLPVISHKKYFFRPINIILDNILTALAPIQNMNSYEKIDLLYHFGAIDYPQKLKLINILNYVLYLRLHQHFKFKEQKIYIEKTDPIFPYFCTVQSAMKSLLVDIAGLLKEKEVLLFKKEYQMALEYNFAMFKRFYGKRSQSTAGRKMVIV